jgi:hypothetical protein
MDMEFAGRATAEGAVCPFRPVEVAFVIGQ